MQLSVFVEPVRDGRFRATSLFGLSAEGSTRDEALQELNRLIAARIAAGAQITQLDVPSAPDNWLNKVIGSMKDFPEFGEVVRLGADYRRSCRADEEP